MSALPTFVLVLFDVPLVVYGWFADAKPYNGSPAERTVAMTKIDVIVTVLDAASKGIHMERF